MLWELKKLGRALLFFLAHEQVNGYVDKPLRGPETYVRVIKSSGNTGDCVALRGSMSAFSQVLRARPIVSVFFDSTVYQKP
jgi:hypothetical protein